MKRLSKMNKKKKILSLILLIVMVIGVSYALYSVGFTKQLIGLSLNSRAKIESLTPLGKINIYKETSYEAKNHPRTNTLEVGDLTINYADNEAIIKISGNRAKSSYIDYYFYLYQSNVNSDIQRRTHYAVYEINPETGEEKCVVADESVVTLSSNSQIYGTVEPGEGEFTVLYRCIQWRDPNYNKTISLGSGSTSSYFYLYYYFYSVQSSTEWKDVKPTFTNTQDVTTAKEIIFVPYEQFNADDNNKRISYYKIAVTAARGTTSTYPLYSYYFENNPDTLYVSPASGHYKISAYGDLSGMFKDFTNLERIDFGRVVSFYNVTSLKSMFEGCVNLKYVDLSWLNLAGVKDLSRMFYGCTNLKYVILPPSVNTHISNIDSMFEGCTNLTSIFVDRFDISNVPGTDVFKGCTSLVGNNFQTPFSSSHTDNTYADSEHYFNEINIIDDSEIYSFANDVTYPARGNTELVNWLSSSQISNIKDVYFVRMKQSELNSQFSTNAHTISSNLKMKLAGPNNSILVVASTGTTLLPENMDYFLALDNLENVYFSNISTEETTSMSYLFSNANITYTDLSCFNLSKVKNLSYAFENNINLLSVNFGLQDTSKVEDMRYMFYGCSNLLFLDLTSIETVSLKYARSMFKNCSKLAYILGIRFDTHLVTDFREMFKGTNNFYYYNFEDWDFSNAIYMKDFVTWENNTNKKKFILKVETNDFRNVTDCTSLDDFFKLDFSYCYIFKLRNAKFSNQVTSFFTPYVTVDGEDNYVFTTPLIFFDMEGTSLPGLTSFNNISYDSNLSTFILKNVDLRNVTSFKNIIVNVGITKSPSYTQTFELCNLNTQNITELGNLVSGNFYSTYLDIGINTDNSWTLTDKLVIQNNLNNTIGSSYTVNIFHLSNIDFSKCISTDITGESYGDFFDFGVGGSTNYSNRYMAENIDYLASYSLSTTSLQELNNRTISFNNINFGKIKKIVIPEIIKCSTSSSYACNVLINGCDLPNVEMVSTCYTDTNHPIISYDAMVKYFSLSNCYAPKLRTISQFDIYLESFEISGLNAPLLVGASVEDGFNNYFISEKIYNIDFSYARLDSVEYMSSIFVPAFSYSSYKPAFNFEGVYFKSLKNIDNMISIPNNTYINISSPSNYTTTQSYYTYYLNFKNAHFEGDNFSMRAAFAKNAIGGYLSYASFENMYIKGVSNMDYAFFGIERITYSEVKYPFECNMNNFTAIGNFSMDYFMDGMAFSTIKLNNAKFIGVTSAQYAFGFHHSPSTSTTINLEINNLTMKGDNFDANHLFAGNSKITKNIYTNDINFEGAKNLSYMFEYDVIRSPLNLSYFDFESLESLEGIFGGLTVDKYLVINNAKFPKNMAYMFRDSTFNTIYMNDSYTNYTYEDGNIYMNGCDFTDVKSMRGLFSSTRLLDSINQINIDISETSLTDISEMFMGGSSSSLRGINEVNINNFDCEDVTDMNSIFAYTNVPLITTYGMGNIDKVEDLSYAFHGTRAETISLPNLTGDNVTNLYNVFWSAENLINLDLSAFRPKKQINMARMFNCVYSKLAYIDISSLSYDDIINLELGIKDFAKLSKESDGAYQDGKPFYVVKDNATINSLMADTSIHNLVRDQLMVTGTMTITGPEEISFAINDTRDKIIKFKMTGRDSTFDNRTITAVEVNPNTTGIHISNVEIDYNLKEVRFYVDSSSITDSTTATLHLSINSIVHDVDVSMISRYCSFNVIKNVGTSSTSFTLRSDGYYESTNNDINSSYNLITIGYQCVGVDSLLIDYHSEGESNYDYGLIGAGGTLVQSSTADTNYYLTCKGNTTPGTYTLTLPASGQGSIDFKYRKDGSVNNNRDSFIFKIRY